MFFFFFLERLGFSFYLKLSLFIDFLITFNPYFLSAVRIISILSNTNILTYESDLIEFYVNQSYMKDGGRSMHAYYHLFIIGFFETKSLASFLFFIFLLIFIFSV
jgi:hypothetical protein